ncbi:hypothetical protein HK105_206583 [Polyrhizophydium stewartii]|uniref:Uncharacterized protein n=1 Tax=Polyrhizophydium stewartii TaxID=2732419 RepID=A0ABR4N2X1_9FUNG
MDQRGRPLAKLSIRQLAGSAALSSLNTGVVEVMALHACDKCIYSKTKCVLKLWLLAMDIARNALLHLNPGLAQPTETINVVLETAAGTEISTVPNNTYMASPDEPLQWTACSFTTIREELVALFAAQPAPIAFQGAIRKAAPDNYRTAGPTVCDDPPATSSRASTTIMAASRRYRAAPSDGPLPRASIPRVVQSVSWIDADSNQPSPFTPLTHDLLAGSPVLRSPVPVTLENGKTTGVRPRRQSD